MSYLSGFNTDNRRVKLEGEAFFEVAQNTEKPFEVEASCVNVVVYGTALSPNQLI
ncbi:MAG: FecR domain-containing protein [Tannerellaceae bacterium]|nr:FecR domain-containing protein [Tannerellaceae bacterium]